MNLFSRLWSPPVTKAESSERPGLNVCLLQKKLERYSTDRLNAAMQAAWNRPYAPTTFFAMNLDDEHGLIKFEGMFIPVFFQDRRLNEAELHGLAVPQWGSHNAFCQIAFTPGGDGLPTSEARHEFTGFISLLCLELAGDGTIGFFFIEDKAFVNRQNLTKEIILVGKTFDPAALSST